MFLTIKLSSHAKLELFEIELFICIKMDLAFDNLQRLICRKTQTNDLIKQQSFVYIYLKRYAWRKRLTSW